LPPRANVCVATLAYQISSAISVFFQDFGHGGVNQPLEPLLLPSLPLPYQNPISNPFSSLQSLRSKPTKLEGLGSPVNSTSDIWAEPRPKLNLDFSLKIWHLVATNLMIFLVIKSPNFMQNFLILWRIWKYVNSAQLLIAIASKPVTGQYGSSTVLQQVNVQSDQQCSWCTHCFMWGCGSLTVGGVVPKLGEY